MWCPETHSFFSPANPPFSPSDWWLLWLWPSSSQCPPSFAFLIILFLPSYRKVRYLFTNETNTHSYYTEWLFHKTDNIRFYSKIETWSFYFNQLCGNKWLGESTNCLLHIPILKNMLDEQLLGTLKWPDVKGNSSFIKQNIFSVVFRFYIGVKNQS